MAMDCGRRIVEMVWEDSKPHDILTLSAFRNAITVDMAIGGSTNAIIHLVALARRRGIDLPLHLFDEIARRVPVLANIRPSGEFLMEDFYYAGGLRALMAEIKDLLHLDCMTVNGKTLGENLDGARVVNRDVIRGREAPLFERRNGNSLRKPRPDGAVIKTAAATRRFWQHTGPAVVFKDYRDMDARMNHDDLNVDENSVLVLQNAGPLGGPGMPEWGMLPIPNKLLRRGVRDMVRISDARMSGTSYGTCVLHVSPESYRGRPACPGQGRRRHNSGYSESETGSPRARGGTRESPVAMDAADPQGRPRISLSLPGACYPGPPRLRFRFPGARSAAGGTGNPLTRKRTAKALVSRARLSGRSTSYTSFLRRHSRDLSAQGRSPSMGKSSIVTPSPRSCAPPG
jgi:hypothetical protein